ncbi:hypothetical protein KEM54_005413 [Ascosphaera aggregata]|nr:hypothetical protein KEM54_005413 [Ascosphaera aggregata]
MAVEVKTDVAASVPKAREILASLVTSFDDAGKSLPSADASTGEKPSIIAPLNGISLLDAKAELLLSYIQNLSLLMFLQLRELRSKRDGETSSGSGDLVEKTHAKLKELKVYLERGVKPLEGKLKYQIDKVLKAADNEDQNAAIRAREMLSKQMDASDEDSGDEDDDDEEEMGKEDDNGVAAENIEDIAYRPNLSSFGKTLPSKTDEEQKSKSKEQAPSDGIYRPPRIKPTALPEHPDARKSKRAEREAARAARSSVIDEYVNSEMSSAPLAQPSIGTTIRQGGRSVRSEADYKRERERREYEEMNLVRLPAESKKERAKRGGNAQRAGGYGGEDFRNLGVSADRIANLTRHSKGFGGVLDKVRKRRAMEDGPRGDGRNVGEGFEKRRKKIASWKK